MKPRSAVCHPPSCCLLFFCEFACGYRSTWRDKQSSLAPSMTGGPEVLAALLVRSSDVGRLLWPRAGLARAAGPLQRLLRPQSPGAGEKGGCRPSGDV